MGSLQTLVRKQDPEKSIIALLEVRFAGPSDPGVAERSHLIREIIDGIPGSNASYYYDRLSNKKSNERISVLFRRVLSSPFRESLLKTLKQKSDDYRAVLTPVPPVSAVPANNPPAGFSSGRLSPPPLSTSPMFTAVRPSSFNSVSIAGNHTRYTDTLRNKIESYLGIENSSIRDAAFRLWYSGKKISAVQATHEWDKIDDRIMFFRYYLDAAYSGSGISVTLDEFVEAILGEELKYEKSKGLNYDQPFPSNDFSARYGSLNTTAGSLRDFRCGASHHRFGQLPDPPRFERELTSWEIFQLMLEEMHLTEEEYYNLDALIRKENFNDDEINYIFSHAYVYRQFLTALQYKTIAGETTLRKYIADWKKEEEYIKKYGKPNDPTRLMKVNPNLIKSTVFRASQNEAAMAAYEILKKVKAAFKKVAPYISLICDFIPYVGQIKGLIEGVAGIDIITGDELAGWQRVLAILPGGIEHSGSLLKGAKYLAKTAAKAAKSPELLVVLTLATKTGKHPIEIINNMKAVAAMSETAIKAAGEEAKVAKVSKALQVTETQAEAIREIRKAADQIKAAKPVPFPSLGKYAPGIKTTAAVIKHAPALTDNGDPAVNNRGNNSRITAQNQKPKPAPAQPADNSPALPPKDKRSRKRARSRKQLWFRYPPGGLRIIQSLLRLSKRGYQVYILKAADDTVLYVGKSGGAGGLAPQSWLKRISEHIKDTTKGDWIGSVDKITVTSGLNEAEAFALEEVLIEQTKHTNKNLIPGEFSKRFPQSSLSANYQSALQKTPHNFNVDIVN